MSARKKSYSWARFEQAQIYMHGFLVEQVPLRSRQVSHFILLLAVLATPHCLLPLGCRETYDRSAQARPRNLCGLRAQSSWQHRCKTRLNSSGCLRARRSFSSSTALRPPGAQPCRFPAPSPWRSLAVEPMYLLACTCARRTLSRMHLAPTQWGSVASPRWRPARGSSHAS